MSGARETFGAMADGTPVERLRLRGAKGFEVSVITYGAAIQSILAPDAKGDLADVVLGFDDLDGYVHGRGHLGGTIGRFANRIAGGRFSIDGRDFTIPHNNGPNTLHGGAKGFDHRLFKVEEADERRAVLSRISTDGEEGFPGELRLTVSYEVEGTALTIEMTATSDAPTIVNLTNHAYFNLSGAGTALDHELSVAAQAILPVAPDGIPTGEPMDVAETPFDFREARPIAARLREGHPQIMAMRGYDHNYCLDGGRTTEPRDVARLFDPASGRAMTLQTTEPGLQVYSGNSLDGAALGRGGHAIRQGDGLCLEAQNFPDAPNRPDFPNAILRPGETYRHVIRLIFSTGRPQ
ncbi:aldose epimerase family protein [Aureimonas mangrovi]|uniref:aldose epimerase family protein n=1 Tax=Aureimonas mangrovi TaxID=2758041 RepID=UPI00163DB5B8|nr:aldose epimerase family protein [Aureimonas mangrovi]